MATAEAQRALEAEEQRRALQAASLELEAARGALGLLQSARQQQQRHQEEEEEWQRQQLFQEI